MSSTTFTTAGGTVGVHPVDQTLPAGRLVPLAHQHVLVMYAGAVAVPPIIGRALRLPPEDVAFLIPADLFACGLATLVQSLGFPGVGIPTDFHNLFVVAVSGGFGMIPLVAPDVFRNLPNALHALLESGILLAAPVAVFLDFFFNALGSAEEAAESAAEVGAAAERI